MSWISAIGHAVSSVASDVGKAWVDVQKQSVKVGVGLTKAALGQQLTQAGQNLIGGAPIATPLVPAVAAAPTANPYATAAVQQGGPSIMPASYTVPIGGAVAAPVLYGGSSLNPPLTFPTAPSAGQPTYPQMGPPAPGGAVGTRAPGTDKYGRPIAVGLSHRAVAACPHGYVAVDLNGDGVADACVLKRVAIDMGLWHARRKPPISAGDWHRLRVAERVRRKAKRIASAAGFVARPKGHASTRRKTSSRRR